MNQMLTFENLLLTESFANDGRGAPVLVGVGQNVVFAENLPILIVRTLFLAVSVDPSEQIVGKDIRIRATVQRPDGVKITVGRGDLHIEGMARTDIPGNVQLPLPVNFEAETYGRYQYECSFSLDGGESVTRNVNLWVLETQA